MFRRRFAVSASGCVTAWRWWLLELCQDEKSLLRPSGRKTLSGFLVMLSQLRRQITSATRQFRASINRSADVKRLTTR